MVAPAGHLPTATAARAQSLSRKRSFTAPQGVTIGRDMGVTLQRDLTAVLAADRLRWQSELAFKRLKSLLHIDRLPTRTERGSRSWLYAHLILAVLCDDLSQDFLESSP